MATRRPASSRARVNNGTNLIPLAPPPRSRSVMSGSASSTRLGDHQTSHEPSVAPPTYRHQRNASSQEDVETNIQVVVRCRRRSEREIQENSPIIVSSTGAKSKDISIETSAPVSSLGITTLPPIRTYPFDLVFGPEADQAMIYHDVVSPMLDEVLMGYNCTLFAYGQTGTGKTYTMQGDLTPTPMGNPSSNAGMIPRVLFRLFHHLETSKTDYSVKISYIELYNEELRDLLANDLSAPIGSTQPMGMANKDANKNIDNGLKIFDDTSKRGVVIQGLEEIPVKDSQDALSLLTKGSIRRQIAATKFNDHSSRSHSVFSIIVHTKEASAVGEDLLKTGKLNLVDLAGSENIGRSGAENKRAKEAGMINQSLLTLGRVINALVDKAPHIPYRESKLTRLLQDSLGGCTKTCLVATISPARSNMEETLSTLDYALRAKSIRNKPELNQRMTRNSLLKEYVGEIERLKSDLLAAREKNGIFFSEETWNQMTREQELKQTELDEAKKQVDIVESQMRAVREEFEQSIGLLKIREGELKEVRAKLATTEGTLLQRDEELSVVKSALEEEIVISKSHQETEVHLDGIAHGLKEVVKRSMHDVEGLFEKLERKTAIFNSNSQAVLINRQTISTSRRALSQNLDAFLKSSSQSTRKLQSEVKGFQTKELKVLSSHSKKIDQQLKQIQDTFDTIQGKDVSEAEAFSVVQNTLKDTHDTFKIEFEAWGECLKTICMEMSKQIESTGLAALFAIEASLKTMSSLVETIVLEQEEYVNLTQRAALEAKKLADDTSNKEVSRLKEQNEILAGLLETERARVHNAKDELIQRVSTIIGDFAKERDEDLQAAITGIQGENKKWEENVRGFSGKHTAVIEQIKVGSADMNTKLGVRCGEGKRTRDGAYKSLSNANAAFSNEFQKLQNTVSGSITSYSAQMQGQIEAMTGSCTSEFERYGRAKRARIDATTSMVTDAQSEYRHLQRGIASTSRNMETFSERIISEASGLENMTEVYGNAASKQLDCISEASDTLSIQGAREDMSTGFTPRKRVWDYVDSWKLTGSRDAILRNWREQDVSDGSGTFLAEHLPLPEGDEDLDEPTIMRFNHISSKPLDDNPDAENTLPSETASSLLSSTSSSTPSIHISPPRPTLKKATSYKKGAPSLGTLTDSRNVYTTRGTRRAR